MIARALFLALVLAVNLPVPAHAANSKYASLAGNPGLRSASAIVLDGQGNVIYSKDENTVRPIASITKLMTAMVILDAGLDLDEKLTITRADRDLIRMTGSRLGFGATLTRRELILLALMSSENRAATALGRTYPGGMEAFVAQMNAKAQALGMHKSRFADSSGLRSENVSTASDLAKMVTAASRYPLITQATTTVRHEVRPYASKGPLNYGNTNHLLKNDSWNIELSKTGYINEAGRCLVMQANIDGEHVSIILLNSFGKLTPFGDSNRLRKWMLASS
ncbi:MAG: D-alanyl-D-alanine endopeptidase [Pseudomonadales bacterium]|nr:D-alanyl-D-alanine endopeptidase [Halieaceae bacterium]MCP5164512.1 D-alanyl-D-alanine endopeptidase [Pseudomonadales bacterium]MCP5190117.1 D-alanyl-D-alanine endopeptidase [Pseudomonadales bacterium]